MDMEGRMSICNMSIEGGARVGYVNPDRTTFDFLQGRPEAPDGDDWDRAVDFWRDMASDPHTACDDEVVLEAADIEPVVTWGTNPGQSAAVTDTIPDPERAPGELRDGMAAAIGHMKLRPGAPLAGTPIDVAFIGSCTNSRLTDLREAARVVEGRRVSSGVKALVVPGSRRIAEQADSEGLREVFEAAGFEWRGAGCSMCLAMNPDKLEGAQISASSSNRNFVGRQGSPDGRTLLMSPAMVAAAAVAGRVTDVRELLGAN